VIQATNGSAALELIKSDENHIDAMLLDVTLPGASSREVLEETRQLRPDLIAILTSAYGREEVNTLMAGLAVENFIRKPFHIDDLVTLLRDSAFVRASSVHST
jgi:DNA-binding response OmpR family regulator